MGLKRNYRYRVFADLMTLLFFLARVQHQFARWSEVQSISHDTDQDAGLPCYDAARAYRTPGVIRDLDKSNLKAFRSYRCRLAVDDFKILGSEDGSSLVVLFDGHTGAWPAVASSTHAMTPTNFR